MFVRLIAVCLVVLCACGPLAGGAGAQETQRPFSAIVDEWNKSLELTGQELSRGPELPAERVDKLRQRLAKLRKETRQIEAKTKALLRPLRTRIEALGPPPAEGEPPESEAVAAERQKINEEIANYDSRIKQAILARKRINELDERISAQSFDQALQALLKPYPLPLAASTIGIAVPEFFALLTEFANAPFVWWQGLTLAQRNSIPFNWIGLVLGFALVLGLGLRFALLYWLGRDPKIEDPTYARRLSAGISEGLALGIVPALIFGGMLYAILSDPAMMTGLFADILIQLCIIAIFLVLAYALPRAVLAPELPSWRLVALSPENARIINHRITFLACVFAVDMFITVLHEDGAFPLSAELISLFEFTITTLEVAGILALVRRKLWIADHSRDTEDPAQPQRAFEGHGGDPLEAPRTGSLWSGLRLLINITAVVAFAATLFGYAKLGAYLSMNLLGSGILVGGLVLVRGLARELIGVALRTRLLREQLAVGHGTRSLFKFWIRALLDLVIFSTGFLLILAGWGVPLGDIWTWTKRAMQGITIGNVTISVTDILIALALFVAALMLTRVVQRMLSERILPRTNLDVGLRHSLSAGLGYLGLVIALAIGIAAMGLDLTNLALIFGALSVGIGFGLQNVVNNFVSGMILLIERPVKVGDWVIVGPNEGFVKRIKLRATEIETFQRASILIPNSEIISLAVTNWTYKDRYGRVDVPVHVAYGSDAEQVIEILTRCLKEHREVVDWPAPFVLFMRLGESAMQFEARGYIANIENMFLVRSDLLVAMENALREAGIVIPLPQRDLRLKNIDQLAEAVRGQPTQTAAPPRLRKVGAVEGQGDS